MRAPKSAPLAGYNPSKARSKGQKAALAQLNTARAQKHAEAHEIDGNSKDDDNEEDNNEEHVPFEGSAMQIELLEERVELYEKGYRNEVKKAKWAKSSLDKTKEKLEKERAEWEEEKKVFAKRGREAGKEISELKKKLKVSNLTHSNLRADKENLCANINCLNKVVSRAVNNKNKAVLKAVENTKKEVNTFQVKEKGVVTDSVQDLARDLVAVGLKPGMVGPAVNRVLSAAGVNVNGTILHTTTCRAIIKGGVAADLQMTEAMKNSDGFVVSGDGTTHRSLNYELHFVTVNKDGSRKNYFAGITTAPNHTSQEQCDAWERLFRRFTDLYNHSPLGKQKGDHAEDQKLLAKLLENLKRVWDCELRGEEAMLDMNMVLLASVIMEATTATVYAAGGAEAWASLSPEEQAHHTENVYRAIYQCIGQNAFESLSLDQQRTIDLFVWMGCEIHKDLNTVKAGAVAMGKWWEANNVPGPKKLLNRSNKDAAKLGGAAGKNAKEVSVGGAIKATSIAGALFNHKNDKTGQHDTYKIFMEEKLGCLATFPDTSNNRFQTHTLAAEQLIVNLEAYKDFLCLVKDKKEKRNWNNLEQNLWDALNDLPTLHELAALAVYSQTISVPYVAHVCQNPDRNALDMGPYHQDVLAACKAVINNPNVVLGADTFHAPATLGGGQFYRPEVMYAVHRMAPSLPHLCPLVQRFFTGAYEAWPCFMTEFAAGGKIVQLTAEERKCAARNTTNDLNESAFGIFRRNWRFAAHTSILYHNS
ncbi:hypothetical protein BT96DRAFT_1009684 [Gymnopus androsaceus JB14]|uniref:Uncharacterized protein n=1 Tax=Gymnopus androsaceus JB14 TaxID=1447944 RepID=A0A6A4GC66_9AGAR|nr:hypothetical protein BT96DRAFT_1009684 [Gymnopus androsaceus JB14]